MSDVSQNPSFHPSKPPHKFSNKHVLLKNKPTKKSTTRSRNKNNNNNLITLNNSNNNNNNDLMMLNNSSNSNNNNRPLKVVHISNPMKFQVAAAGFRALVQGLTGRDSVVEWPIDHDTGHVAAAAATTIDDDSADGVNNSTDDHHSSHNDDVNDQHNDEHHHYHQEGDDEVVINNHFSSSVSSACFEPSDHLHHHLMSFDYYFGTHFNGDVTTAEDQLYGCYGGLSSPSFCGRSLLH